jgi:hypothetical protein
LHQHHCLDDDSNIDESHQVESMEDIRVSAWVHALIYLTCINLPVKRLRLILEMWLGKSSLHKLRVIFDSGSFASIIVAKFIKKLHVQNDTKTEQLTKEGIFHSSGKCKINFILNEFYKNKVIEWTLHVNKTSCHSSLMRYDNQSWLIESTWNNSQFWQTNHDMLGQLQNQNERIQRPFRH